MGQLFSQIWKGFESLPVSRKLTILVAAGATLLSIALAVVFINQPEYKILFTNLSTEDAGQITARLQEKKIPYQLSPAGDMISVPSEKVSELRLELASSGLPKGGGVGFEIFDTKSLGVTEFVQQLNYQRALQGELTRTINSLDEIQQSRVHLVIPKKSLFSEDQKKPTASVIVRLKNGRNLSEPQIQGIAHLVSSSIEGMSPRDVMIVDSSGKVLSKVTEGGELAQLSNSQIEYKKNVEKDLTGRITSMLEKVVGDGKAVVRITADLDFRVMEKTEEKFDSEEPAIRSVQRSQEKSGSTSGSAGESSVTATGRQPATPARPAGSNRDKTDETINYEISRTVNKTVMPVGDMKKLSIAVLVDGNYVKNDKGVEEYQPRPEKELTALEDLVKKSAGFDLKRGDQVVVSNVAFKKIDLAGEMPEKSWLDKLMPFMFLARYLVILAVIALAALFVIKPLVGMLVARGKEAGMTIREVPATAGELRGGEGVTLSLGAPQQPRGELTEADIVQHMASADAKRFAELLRNWIK
jgi:flagellar M-ring protein FliF